MKGPIDGGEEGGTGDGVPPAPRPPQAQVSPS